MEEAPTFKCILVGDGRVGKSTFIHRHLTGDYEKSYVATKGVKCHSMVFNTNLGKMQFIVWDMAGMEKNRMKRSEVCYYKAQCAILMFDRTSISSYKNISKWHRELVTVCGDIPMVLVGNKIEVPEDERKVLTKSIVFHRENNMQYYDISVKKLYNCEKPFLSLARRLYDSQMQFIPYVLPNEHSMDAFDAFDDVEEDSSKEDDVFYMTDEAISPASITTKKQVEKIQTAFPTSFSYSLLGQSNCKIGGGESKRNETNFDYLPTFSTIISSIVLLLLAYFYRFLIQC